MHPTELRNSLRHSLMFFPLKKISPLSGLIRVSKQRIVVDLPAPLQPRKPKISPSIDSHTHAIQGLEFFKAFVEVGDLEDGWHIGNL
jgi:hypothetical protein